MNILILNLILSTAEKGVITRRESIKDSMICNIAQGFILNGHKVTLIAADEFKPVKSEEYDFEVIFLPSKLTKIFKPHLIPFSKGLKKYLNANIEKFDMVITSEAFSMATLVAAPICKEKLVIWQEMSLHQRMLFKLPAKFWYNIITRFLMRRQLIIPRSEPAYKFISKYSNNVSTTLVDHGANGILFKPADNAEDCFIIVSRLVKGKNVDKMIMKFKDFIADAAYSHYKLHIVGDGEEHNNLKHLVQSLNITNNVFLHGYMRHDKFRSYLSQSKGLLIDTIKDNNMISIAEALVSGTPVLSNSLPTNSYFIKKNDLGIIKDNWGAQELKEMIDKYNIFHQNCLDLRDEISSQGSSKQLSDTFVKWRDNRYKL